jgi:imidazolonepropionase-like amidohydrolase
MADDGPRQALRIRGVSLPDEIERDVYVVDGCFTFKQPERARTILEGGFLLPGLVDMHAHLALASPAPTSAPPSERVRASARLHLEAGVLAVREPGSPNRGSKGIGPAEGLPRLFTAGRFLTAPGTYFPGLAREVAEHALAPAAVEESRHADGWSKVVGDWRAPDGSMRPNFSRTALAEAAERVHLAGGRVAIHATIPETVEAAIEAGFDSIEHALGITPDHLEEMARRGIAFVPTLTILPELPSFIQGLGLVPASERAMQEAVRRHPEMARRAIEAGVVLLAGTDAGMGPHGALKGEIERLVRAGAPPELALGAGSWTARRFLGLTGIEEGAPADLVAYSTDPRLDIEVLSKPVLRVLAGRVVEE